MPPTVNRHEPMQTSICVRKPAACSLISRSTPMTPPHAAATARRNIISSSTCVGTRLHPGRALRVVLGEHARVVVLSGARFVLVQRLAELGPRDVAERVDVV